MRDKPTKEETMHPAYTRYWNKIIVSLVTAFGLALLGDYAVSLVTPLIDNYWSPYGVLAFVAIYLFGALVGLRWARKERREWEEWRNVQHQRRNREESQHP